MHYITSLRHGTYQKVLQYNTIHTKLFLLNDVTERSQTIRSVQQQNTITLLMLVDRDLNSKHHVVNTGIVGASKDLIQKLKYFDNFDSDMAEMSKITKL